MTTHRPVYVYCSDPETCCGHWWPVVIVCAECDQRWPCETKRSHHTPAHAARVQRWAEGRRGRPPVASPPMDLTREFDGIQHRKSSFSGAGNDCVYINRDLTAIADSKGDMTLPVGRSALLALTAHLR